MIDLLGAGSALTLPITLPVDGTYYEVDGEFYTSAYKRVLIRRKDVS